MEKPNISPTSEMFNLDTSREQGTPAAPAAPVPDETPPVPDETPPVPPVLDANAPSWQGKYDQVTAEYAKLKQEAEELKALKPLAEFLQQPNTLEAVRTVLEQRHGQNGVSQPAGAPSTQPPPERPSRPEKPAGFSYIDADQDPNSSSARYLQKVEQYHEDLASYNERLARGAQESTERITRESAEERRLRQILLERRNEAVGWGASEVEADAYIAHVTSLKPGSPELNRLLYKGYLAEQGQAPAELDKKRRADEAKRQAELRKSTPAPPAAATGESTPPTAKPGEKDEDVPMTVRMPARAWG